jgi:excisionase family DNA binding protein
MRLGCRRPYMRRWSHWHACSLARPPPRSTLISQPAHSKVSLMRTRSQADWAPPPTGDRGGPGRDPKPATGIAPIASARLGQPPNANDRAGVLARPDAAEPSSSSLTASSPMANTPQYGTHGAPMLDIPEVGRRLKVCVRTVRRFITRGDLGAYRVGRQLRISEEELLRFLELRR